LTLAQRLDRALEVHFESFNFEPAKRLSKLLSNVVEHTADFPHRWQVGLPTLETFLAYDVAILAISFEAYFEH
jgi:hypothetical protein